jgi:hypothetical protein
MMSLILDHCAPKTGIGLGVPGIISHFFQPSIGMGIAQ